MERQNSFNLDKLSMECEPRTLTKKDYEKTLAAAAAKMRAFLQDNPQKIKSFSAAAASKEKETPVDKDATTEATVSGGAADGADKRPPAPA